ncbi:uncharacterized protein LOC119605529 [Lucilia sericata]|uniref:uncharacterized protein LOC119605529 n=1 Tax=Lucilia sericata TaxID=13632 RepID=UPI0018A827BB|nr:uncharacterized protein LOC119605529 [Lucilia sericata]
MSKSPDSEKQPKKRIAMETPRSTQPQVVEKEEAYKNEKEKAYKNSEENGWKTVKHRKEKRKKEKTKTKIRFDQGEALTIKANTDATYADVLKEMKKNIDPSKIGVDIKTMRRTINGDILIKFNKGEGQAEKLTRAIGNTLGNNVTIKTVKKNCIVDIRDMDESTEQEDIISALKTVTDMVLTDIKILNVRESFGKTKQALVQIQEDAAAILLRNNKIRIGWVMCRVRKKDKAIQCFKCLDQGHMAKSCNGVDRTNICRKCCNSGHKFKDCKEEMRCIICQEEGLKNTKHYIGSMFCINNRRENQRND